MTFAYPEMHTAAVRTCRREISTPLQKLCAEEPEIRTPAAHGNCVGEAICPSAMRAERTSSSVSGGRPCLARTASVWCRVRTSVQSIVRGSTPIACTVQNAARSSASSLMIEAMPFAERLAQETTDRLTSCHGSIYGHLTRNG